MQAAFIRAIRGPAFLAILCVSALAQLPFSPPVPASRAVGYKFISEAPLRADLEYLTSKPLAGRMSLSPGADMAIQFIADDFKKAGLKPIANGSYLQPLEIIEYHPDLSQMGLTLIIDGKPQSFAYLKDFTGVFPQTTTVSGDVVFAGYGITAPEFNHYDDYAGIDVKGKIVMIFDHEPQEDDPKSIFNGVGNTRYANAHVKIVNAQKHGAIAVLLANEPNRKHPSNFERLARIKGLPERYKLMPQQQLADADTRIPLFTISDDVVNATFAASGQKASEVQAQLDKTLKPVKVNLAGVTAKMKIVNTDRRVATTYNVAGLLEGGDPKLKDETVIYSAHYDHDGSYGGKMYPGADDNGSGTVGVMELARAYAANVSGTNGATPRRSILFIVFAAEERGLLGSYYYAAHPVRPLATTRAQINFDMIGRNETPSAQTNGLIQIAADTSSELNLIGTNNSPDYKATVAQADQTVGLKLNYKWDQDAALNVFQRSDQFPLALHNVPAVWWFTGFHPDYHQPTDTIEKINFEKMVKILRLAYLSGFQFADTASPPKYQERVEDCGCTLP
ncbi:MAG: M28 family peptidase [Acidobacteriaceae bacterium]